MLKRKPLLLLSFILIALTLSGCIKPSDKVARPKLLKTENAAQADLVNEVNRFARINSMRAKMYLKFEDNSFAESGIAEKYKSADGDVVVQRPAKILMKVQVPVIKSDIAQMTSDGTKFRVAILQDGGSGKYKKFVLGTNAADYSLLQEKVKNSEIEDGQVIKQNVNAFSNLRPQHFTDAMLVRPIDAEKYLYLMSTITQEEVDFDLIKKKSPLGWVLRGYYLLDEFQKEADGSLRITRRFWFDRVGGTRLARQQIFDAKGEIESDIVYGQPGNLGESGEYNNLPLEIFVTRPKEKYKMRLTYQSPESVAIGKTYPDGAFVLENTWGLEEVDLDKKLQEAKAQKMQSDNSNTATRPPQ
ncbi:MAG: hypothetical protein JSS81_20740 [Acidobacteria bacterium]|nr:hypothetical protein [Acidobacteriota bacterium]